MEEDIEHAHYQVSLGRDLSSIFDADHPVQDERWSPGQDTIDYDHVDALGKAFAMPDSDIEISDLTPQAVEVEMEYQTQAKHDREITGRTPAPQLKKQRNDDYDLNDSPLQEGFHRTAVAAGDWQPSTPVVVEDDEMITPRLRWMSWLDKTKGMRSFERRQDRQRVHTYVPDRMHRAGEGPKCPDLELDPLRGATAQYPCARHAGTGAPTARPKRRTGARGKPASRMEPVGA
eukprot:8670929-Pyramimonas_sp.AAC.1